MTIAELEQIFTDQQAFRQLTESIRPGSTVQLASLVGSSLSLVAHGAIARLGGVHVLVAEDRDAAGYLYNDLYPLTGGEGLFFFPTGYKRSIQYGQEDPSGLVQRTTALNALRSAADKPLILCTYPEALTEKVADRERLSDSVLKLRRGDNLSTAFVEEALRECRFERVEFVYEPGQYSVRGGIVDIFSYSDNKPYRIDFFGDEIDSIRPFDVGTQLSTGTLDEVEIVPNLKTVTSVEHRVSLARFAGEVTYWIADGDYTLKRFDDIRTKILGDLDEPSSIDTLVTSRKGFLSDAKKAAFVLLRDNVRERPAEVRVAFDTTPQPEFNKKFDLLADDINANRLRGYSTCLLSDNKAQIERLSNIFNSIGEKNVVFDSVPLALHAGFVDHTSKNCFYTDHQIFDRYQRYRIRGELDRSESLTIQELNSLKVGDYVVHIDHGVGRFGGLTRTVENGKVHEAIKLVYRDNDVLLVNVHALHRISKYKDKDSEPPKIYKLGSGAWQRMKLNTKKAVKDIARELIALYAKRQASRGFAFSPDSYMQHELEASFIYEDTPDQQTATQLVKQDMESPVPMDRLVCGDVGFGKTEIAIRAAFKAVTDSKQVAVLVPTTILALQHYRTFNERLKEFPVRIEHLSRLKSAKETRQILEEVKSGKIDILIGTQIVTKGFDFGGVSLVGILNADNLLNYPDFRAGERAFQLMTQVGGRAGRRSEPGTVVIQTAQPQHPVIEQVLRGDYGAMVRSQLAERRAFFYPPYCRLITVVMRHRDKELLWRAAGAFAGSAREVFGRRLLGPEAPPVDRIRGRFLVRFLLKIERRSPSAEAKRLLQELFGRLHARTEFRSVEVAADVDPM